MNPSIFSRICSVFFLFFGILSGISAEGSDRYRIEILIFENSSLQGIDNEQLLVLDNLSMGGVSLTMGGEGLFKTSPSDSLALTGTRDKLTASGSYRIIYHTGWSQQVTSKDSSTPVLIDVPGMKGTINVYKKRHLHLNADLIYNSLEGNVRLSEHRRMSAKELHYLDHPLFGILVRAVKL